MCNPFTVTLILCFAVAVPVTQGDFQRSGQRAVGATGDAKPKPTLEEAYRQWHRGFTSKKKEDREKTLRSMLASQKDVECLFPKHAEKLWPLWAKGNEFLLENVDKIADEVTKGGEIKAVEAIDVRKDKDRSTGQYKRLLEIIPKDVPVFDYEVRRANGGGSFVYLNHRWIWIKDLDTFPKILEKLK